MNIWTWVHAAYPELKKEGHNRLVTIMKELPSFVVDEEIAKIDALVPEALALCKQQKNPWIEVYIRHWNLQSRVLGRDEGEGQLQEAISLLDYASQETTKDCPQSICVVQDLAVCYANIDHIGYADECLAVSQETLSRIDPSWNCYPCIVSELLNAKSNKGLDKEVLEEIQYHRKQIKLAKPNSTAKRFILDEVSTLKSLGRYQEAFDLLKTADNPNGGKHYKNKCQLLRGQLYAHLEDYNKALNDLLPFSMVFNVLSLADRWCDLCYILAKKGLVNNNWRLNHFFEQLCQKWLDLGCLRSSFENTVLQTKLAIKRQQADTTKACLQRLKFILPKLKADGGAAENIAKLEQALAEIPALAVNMNNINDLLTSLPEDPEQRLAILDTALITWADSGELTLAKMSTLALLDQDNRPFAETFLEKNPNNIDVLRDYGFNEPNISFIDTLFEQEINQETLTYLYWIKGHYCKDQSQLTSALELFQKILEINATAQNTIHECALLTTELKQYSQAVDYWQQLILLEPDNNDYRWDLMVSATLAKSWQVVREQAEILDLGVEDGEGVIDEIWNWIRIKWPTTEDDLFYKAIRTGPVTARIYATGTLGEEKVYCNEVVFNPLALNTLSEKNEEGEAVDEEGYDTLLFPLLKIIYNAKDDWQRFDLDGVYPGVTAWNPFLEALSDLDIQLIVRSSNEYQLNYQEQELPAVYAYLMVPKNITIEELNQHLLRLTQDFEHPMIWELVAYISKDIEINNRMTQIVERYQIAENHYDEMNQDYLV